MDNVWVYTLLSVAVVSVISFVGALTLAVRPDSLKKWLLYLVAFAAGALLGDVFLHILPEMSAQGFTPSTGYFFLLGIFIFFALERFIWWHHSHSGHDEEIHSVVYLTQAGDTLHNFIDGIIIAASFFVSTPVGIATTIAVIFHEIPQEIGNFAILLHGGWTAKKALFYNFLSALASVVGALVVLIAFRGLTQVPMWLIAMAASSFIYIAMADLIPEMNQKRESAQSWLLLTWFVLGTAAMALLLLLE